MTERELLTAIQIAATRHGARLFRNSVAVAWTGRATKLPDGSVLIRDPRPIKTGLVNGASDLIGWTADGRFLAVEAKTGRVQTTLEQRRFIAAVNEVGGSAGVARSVEDAVGIMKRAEIKKPGADETPG